MFTLIIILFILSLILQFVKEIRLGASVKEALIDNFVLLPFVLTVFVITIIGMVLLILCLFVGALWIIANLP
jgi:hypothetical protein